MPFKSKSQMKLFAAKMKRGEISKATFDRWVKHTKNIKGLPKKVKKKTQLSPKKKK